VLFGRTKSHLPAPEQTLPGRPVRPFTVPGEHAVLGTPLEGLVPDGFEVAYFGMGCFWGAERRFWQVDGVWSTSVGYQGGGTPNPTYDEVCTGLTGHDEAVRVVYDPARVSYRDLLAVFWETHDPTQGYRQGNDVGTQYRSAAYWTTDEQRELVESTRSAYQDALTRAGLGAITTEVGPAPDFFYAEAYHQQYLAKNPHGYDCHASTGVPLPSGE
jgi:peptide-methionine (S)-S-oxide reductase